MSDAPLIVARIEGGIGNQMLSYAATRALSLRSGVPIKLDVHSGFVGTRYGDWYQLDKFNIGATIADASERLDYEGRYYYWRRKLDRRLPLSWRRVIDERNGRWEPGFLTLKPSRRVWIWGYWQREEYFRDQAGAIRAEFTAREPYSARNLELGARMRSCESVSVHLRQGKDFRFRLSDQYYAAALRLIRERVKEPKFFVFGRGVRAEGDYPQEGSGAPAQELEFPPDTTFIDHNAAADAHADMWLMSQCRHAVVANSTFSWLGAWLNPATTGRVVVAPERWGYQAVPAAGWLTVGGDGLFSS